MFPAFREDDVIASQVARARVAEPVHRVGARRKPDPFAAPGLVVASSAHVYPDIVHGQAILGVAERIADGAGCPCARVPAPLGSGMTMTARRSAP